MFTITLKSSNRICLQNSPSIFVISTNKKTRHSYYVQIKTTKNASVKNADSRIIYYSGFLWYMKLNSQPVI